jgi:hypothetical protein
MFGLDEGRWASQLARTRELIRAAAMMVASAA